MYTSPYRQGLGTLQRTLERIDRDLESKTACVSFDKECIEVQFFVNQMRKGMRAEIKCWLCYTISPNVCNVVQSSKKSSK